jgi:hypothetical protein
MASAALFLHDLPRRSDRNEHARRYSTSSTTLYWHDSGLQSAGQGHWPPSRLATTDSSTASTPFATSPSAKEPRRSRLASKSILGLNLLWTGFCSKSNDPSVARQSHQHLRSTSRVDISSLDASYSPQNYLQASYPSLHDRPNTKADLSTLVPDYLDLPPPYSSPTRERQEVIDWKAYFERTPLLTTTATPHSTPAIQDVVSPATPLGGTGDCIGQGWGW